MTTAADRNARRARVRSAKAQEAARQAAEQAVRQEIADEAVSPAAQRKGTALRGPRLVRDGNTFRAYPTIAMLVANGQKRAERGLAPVVTVAGAKAAVRLRAAWEASQSVTHGVASYAPRGSATPETGVLAQAILRAVGAQINARAEVAAARRGVGRLWPVVDGVVLRGLSVEAYADAARADRKAMIGKVGAALKVLAGFYEDMDRRG